MDVSLRFVWFQHLTSVNGFDGSTECRGDYPEQLHKLRFTHPYISCIGWYSYFSVLINCDGFPFHGSAD